jgi:hypothetical protein
MDWRSASPRRHFGSETKPLRGSGGRVLTDATGERRNWRFRQHFRGFRACRPIPNGESGLISAVGPAAQGLMNKLPAAKRAQILHLQVEGSSMRAVARIADV